MGERDGRETYRAAIRLVFNDEIGVGVEFARFNRNVALNTEARFLARDVHVVRVVRR